MKFSKDKLAYISEKSENLYRVLHAGEVFTFETPIMGIPFGVDQEFGKTKCRLEFPVGEGVGAATVTTQHQHLRKILEKIEKYVCERFDVKEGEIKSVFRKREGGLPDLIECRIKETKNGTPLTKVVFENKSDSYLKTIYTVPEKSHGIAKIEWFGVYDYRDQVEEDREMIDSSAGVDDHNGNYHKIGIVINILHLRVRDSRSM